MRYSHQTQGTVIEHTDFDVIIGQCVVSDRNLICAILIRHKALSYNTQTLTSSSDSVLCLIGICYALFSSDTRHCHTTHSL